MLNEADHGGVSAAARVVVVGADPARLAQYQAALGLAEAPFRTTMDLAEAEALIGTHPLDVLVLDLGLPRLALLQLYGVARSRDGGADIQVLFVGQEGDTGPDDHFLPGEPSPVMVSSWVSDLLAGVEEPPALDLGVEDRSPLVVGEAPGAESEPAATFGPGDEAAVPPNAALVGDASPVTAEPADGEADASPAATAPDAVPAGAAAGAVVEGSDGAEPAPVEAPSRRSYVTLVRIGFVLFILGLLLLLIRLEWNPPSMTPPPPATPAGLQRSMPSPFAAEATPAA